MRPIGCVLALLLSPAALAGKPPVFVVKVVDAAGAPIPHGVVVFPAEGERHVVHGTSGTWTGTGLVTAAGEAPFAQGQEVSLTVGAAGFAPKAASATLSGKQVELVVALDRMPLPPLPCLPPDLSPPTEHGPRVVAWSVEALGADGPADTRACAHAARATGSWIEWESAARAYRASPTLESATAEATARHRAVEAAREWAEWAKDAGTDATVAARLCLAASDLLQPCG